MAQQANKLIKICAADPPGGRGGFASTIQLAEMQKLRAKAAKASPVMSRM
jgi:hypothetical protein